MPSEEIFEIVIPEQGIRQALKKADALRFLDAEIEWVRKFSSRSSNYVAWQGNQLNVHDSYTNMMGYLSTLRQNVKDGKLDDLRAYVAEARKMEFVVGQGSIGKTIDLWLDGNGEEAAWGFLLHSRKFTTNPNYRYLAPLRGALLSNPSVKAGGAADALFASEERTAKLELGMRERLSAYEEQIKRQSEIIEELETLFRKKLPMEEPAVFWEGVARGKENRWRNWLWLFSALTIVPIALIVAFWPWLSPELGKLVSAGNSFSLTGLAAIGVPALLYGWLLKNVSRVFIQQMNLADDAAHRRALTITWLGMVAEKRFEMSEQERALALNAMFRAPPPHMLDDGPPAGLMELLGKK